MIRNIRDAERYTPTEDAVETGIDVMTGEEYALDPEDPCAKTMIFDMDGIVDPFDESTKINGRQNPQPTTFENKPKAPLKPSPKPPKKGILASVKGRLSSLFGRKAKAPHEIETDSYKVNLAINEARALRKHAQTATKNKNLVEAQTLYKHAIESLNSVKDKAGNNFAFHRELALALFNTEENDLTAFKIFAQIFKNKKHGSEEPAHTPETRLGALQFMALIVDRNDDYNAAAELKLYAEKAKAIDPDHRISKLIESLSRKKEEEAKADLPKFEQDPKQISQAAEERVAHDHGVSSPLQPQPVA